MIMWILDLEGARCCEKYKMNGSWSVEFFHVEMASRTDMAVDQLNLIIDDIFSSVEKFEPIFYLRIFSSKKAALP